LQPYSSDSELANAWERWARRLVGDDLQRNPLLLNDEYQNYAQSRNRALQKGDELAPLYSNTTPIELSETSLFADLRPIVRQAGFPEEVSAHIQARVAWRAQPSFVFDSAATGDAEQRAADGIVPVMVEHPKGEVVYRKGDKLSAQQYTDLLSEREAYAAHAKAGQIWLPRIGILGLVGVLALFSACFVAFSYPRIVRNTLRVIALLLLITAMLAVTVAVTAQAPKLLFAAAIARPCSPRSFSCSPTISGWRLSLSPCIARWSRSPWSRARDGSCCSWSAAER
jgi:membrane-associated HD superfamily phosphohydrolase